MVNVTPVTVREGRADSSALSNQSLQLPGKYEQIQSVKNADKMMLPIGTDWVQRDVLGISEEVYRVSGGRCRVASCSCGRCTDKGHFPHVVLEQGKSGRTYPVFGFTSFGPHVLQRLREIHVSQKPNKKSMQDNAKLMTKKKQLADDKLKEKLEVVEAALSSPKFNWRGPDGMRTKA